MIDKLVLNSGAEIPVITVIDEDETELLIAPESCQELLKDGEEFTEEGEAVDSKIFFYATNFGLTEGMLNEITEATDIEVQFPSEDED
jgi:hypothetical protein